MPDKLEKFMELYEELKDYIRRVAPYKYERWKAGGFLIDNDIMSMYPTLSEVMETLFDDEDE